MSNDSPKSNGQKFWRVLEGLGPRVVREGCGLGSPKLPEMLAPGALVEELALEGDRLHYWLQSGSGPTNGWVTVKARGQELLVRCADGLDGPPPEVWIATVGTRGDLQPFVVLGLALQTAGLTVRLFGPPELQSFGVVGDGVLPFTLICGGWGGPPELPEDLPLTTVDGSQEGEAAADGSPEDAVVPSEAAAPPEASVPQDAEPQPESRDLALGRPAQASSIKSPERAASFAVDGQPSTRWTSSYADGQWLSVDLGEVCTLTGVDVRWEAAFAEAYRLEVSLDGEAWSKAASEAGREGWVSTALPSGTKARWVRVFGEKRALPTYGYSIYELCVFGSKANSDGSVESQPDSGAPAAAGANSQPDTEPDPEARERDRRQRFFLSILAAAGVDTNNAGDVGHMGWLWREMPKAVMGIKEELEVRKPDLLLYNHLMVNLGVYAWKSWGVRSIFVNLGLEFYFAPEAKDVFNYRTLKTFDDFVLRPMLGCQTVGSMRPKDFRELYTSPDRILGTTRLLKSVMPFKVKEENLADNWNFTGFWILDQEMQMEDPEGFGGPQLLMQLRNFLAAGQPPVYLGWGSMPVGLRMLAIAVAALKSLGLRAVIVRGWGYFSRGNLAQGIAEIGMEAEGAALREYADKNVLFLDKAPHEWLFPRCACTVHHGGAGTTASALRAGVPTVIVPLGYDQTYHGEWVESLGVGVSCSTVMEIEEPEFSRALRLATSDSDMAERSRKVAATIRQEPGVAGAVAQVRRIIREDVRSGMARRRWLEEEAARLLQEEKMAKQRERVQGRLIGGASQDRRASADAAAASGK